MRPNFDESRFGLIFARSELLAQRRRRRALRAATIGIALAVGCATVALAAERKAPAEFDGVIARHAAANGVPEALIRRVIVRESRYNPRARNGRYYGMMQIAPATARSMGYRGDPSGLLDADVNLTYGVRYLAGAYRVAGGDHGRAVGLYARGYYYDAKRRGMLAVIGMGRNGKLSAPPTVRGEAVAAAPAPQEGSPNARTQAAFASFGAGAPQVAQAPAAPQGAIAYSNAERAPSVPFPFARGAIPLRQTVVAAAVPTPPTRVIDPAAPALASAVPMPPMRGADPKARGSAAILAAAPIPQPRDVTTTGSISTPPRPTLFGRAAPQPAPVAVVASMSASEAPAGPRIPTPAPRDMAPVVASAERTKPTAPRTIAPTTAPVLALSAPTFGSFPPTPPRR